MQPLVSILIPAYNEDEGVRIEMFGDTVDRLTRLVA